MLSRASKEETGGPKTIHLARGQMSPTSPSRPPAVRTPSGNGRSFIGLTGKSKSSSDGSPRTPGPSILHQLASTELLDHDDRPTFILDVGDQLNFEPGPLKVIFANAALKSVSGVIESITGQTVHESPVLTPTTAFSEFKSWATSYVKEHESMDIVLPSYLYAGVIWTCSTLRKRIRVFRAHTNSAHINISSNPKPVENVSSSPLNKGGHTKIRDQDSADLEPQDYFGPAAISALKHSRTTSVERIERHSKTPGHQLPIRNSKRLADRSASRSASASPLGMRNDEAILGAVAAGDVDRFTISSQPGQGFFDWTRLSNSPSLPAHIRFALGVNWASTPLGPIETWSTELRGMCNLIMASPHPAAMYWGPEHVAIYNEAYILLAGSKHPNLMGQGYRKAWPEIWDEVEAVFESAVKTGQATMKDDDCLFISRSAGENLEETYFSWSIIPLVGSDGSVVGLYNPAFEKTRRKVAERRMFTLRELGDRTATARDLKSFWTEVLKGLEYNLYDAPFALLYSVTDEIDSDSQSSAHSNSGTSQQCVLEGTIGVPKGHPAAAPSIDLRNGSDYFAHVFRRAMKKDRPTYLSVRDGTLDPKYLEHVQWRGFEVPCTAAVCCPIHLAGGEQTIGFLVMGVNPRRPYDDDYSLYMQLLGRQLATAMASVVLFEEEIARGRRAAKIADLKETELSKQLQVTTEQAIENELKFTRLSELNPSGMFIADSQGKITYCNAKMYHITNVSQDALEGNKWMGAIVDEDRDRFMKLWASLVHEGTVLNSEIRFKTKWVDQYGNDGDTWVLVMAAPQQDEDGKIKMILGSMTNISQQKWAEHFEKRRMEEAMELKRQQENFIDITSHEMRNPLSAILQCADELTSFLRDLKANKWGPRPPLLNDGLLDEQLDTSNTVSVCGEHQTRIVDDILTLSKLDSGLLQVTPCASNPKSIAQKTLKIFETPAHSHDIDLAIRPDKSLDQFGIEWVNMDPSRVLQILINLITNAIKFTATQPDQRSITITIGASLVPPSGFGHVKFVPNISKRKDLTENTHDWGAGEQVYIHFSVQDTGRGLTDEEKTQLFLRFSQASRHTHLTYGGSGLGLFICRQLAELQGGEIGVASTAGVGSTFAFYIKGRRTTAPPDEPHQPKAVGQVAPATRPSTTKVVSHKKPAATMSNQAPTAQAKPTVLVVEDNKLNQTILAKTLTTMGCDVQLADDGSQCIERLKQSHFWKHAPVNNAPRIMIDIILMDQQMPIMDGMEATRKIREYQRTGDLVAHVPIICTTGNARDEYKQAAQQAGMVSL